MIITESMYDAMIDQVEADHGIFEACLGADFNAAYLVNEGYEITSESVKNTVIDAAKAVKKFIKEKLAKLKQFIINKVIIPMTTAFKKMMTNIKKSKIKTVQFDSNKEFMIPAGQKLVKGTLPSFISHLATIVKGVDFDIKKELDKVKDKDTLEDFNKMVSDSIMKSIDKNSSNKLDLNMENPSEFRKKFIDSVFEEEEETEMTESLFKNYKDTINAMEKTIVALEKSKKDVDVSIKQMERELLTSIDNVCKEDDEDNSRQFKIKAVTQYLNKQLSIFQIMYPTLLDVIYRIESRAVSVLYAYSKVKPTDTTSSEESALFVEAVQYDLDTDTEEVCNKIKKESDDDMDDDEDIEEGCNKSKHKSKHESDDVDDEDIDDEEIEESSLDDYLSLL